MEEKNVINSEKIVGEIKSSKVEFDTVIAELKEKYPIEQFVKYNEFTLQNRLEMLPMKIIEFQDLANDERNILETLENQREIIKGQLYDYFKFQSSKRLTPQEIKEYYIPTHPKIIAIDKLIRKQKWKVSYFDGCTKALDKMSWIVKDFIKTISHNI